MGRLSVRALDSSIARPTPALARAARAAGIRAWGGYLPPGVGLESPWDRASFEVVQAAGLVAIGFASGNDDPDQVAATARAWRVLGCLDDEDGIRAPGGWEQAWLDASGFGLYGLVGVHAGLRARFHIAALYPGVDPGSSWPDAVAPRPPAPCGWQWQGTHVDQVTGLPVDSTWLDDWFGRRGGEAVTVSCARPDGGRDHYTLMADGSLRHVVTDFAGVIVYADPPPGTWAALITAGYRDLTAYVQGYGLDGVAYEITSGASGWSPPAARP